MALPNLSEQPISRTYKGLLHTSNKPINDNTLTPIYDGDGNPSSMRLGGENNDVEFTGKVIASDFKIRKSDGSVYDTLIDYLYPVGSIYLSYNNENPQDRFIETQWTKVSEGRFLVGVGSSTDNNGYTADYRAGDNNGLNKIKLTIENLPSHSHDNVNFVINKNGSPSGTGQTPGETTTAISTLFKDNQLLSEYGFDYIMNTRLVNENDLTSGENTINLNEIPNLGEGITFSGVSIIGDTGNNVAFDNKPPSYGVYVWRRIS